MKWSKDQENAIKARNCNLLVSAAAGSGKTAVLIERILSQVMDKEKPVDIDSILVVTFTKAAAGEMKARLSKAFETALKDNPCNKHLIRQMGLVENAKICTIDSFCTGILKNYYNTIGLEPDFRTAEDGELNLVKDDVLQELLEEKFKEADKDFLDFVEAFSPGKKLDNLSELILDLHRFSQSKPWPMEWLDECERIFDIRDADEYLGLPIVERIFGYIKSSLESMLADNERMEEYCNMPDGPYQYLPAINKDRELLLAALEAKNLEDLRVYLENDIGNIGKAKDVNEELKERVKDMRNKFKERIKAFRADFCVPVELQLDELRRCAPMAKVYINLVKEFTVRFQETKKDKNILDFPDIEHYALDVLVKRVDGACVITEIADELAEQYNYIYIDEYQDSNLVQEYILNAVSRERYGNPNVFMVGDVKQSIYKFRMADPELFMEKHRTYNYYTDVSEDKYKKIELHENYRSRENVLESINDVFYRIMKESVGGVEYSHEVRLNCGNTDREPMEDRTELIIVPDNPELVEDISKEELQAHVIAGRINEMMKLNQDLRFKDFAILLRSDKVMGPIYANVLTEHGIPSVYVATRGYFEAKEILTILNLLMVVDNPRQEIALAGTMRSYFASFSEDELAIIKGRKRKTELYDCVIAYGDKDNELAAKCRRFIDMISSYRERAYIYSIKELIGIMVYDSGYYDYAGAGVGGKVKKANLDMLIEKAGDFEKTSYYGLFNFLRYIERLRKYDTDYGEGKTGSEDENLVRITSIHKSKGLEYPIVFLGNMNKSYNLKDSSKSIIYDRNLGLGMNIVNLEKRYKEKTTYKNMIAHVIKSDSVGEELRILYVAMTRAVNKLIMVGSVSENALEKWENAARDGITSNYVLENTNYLSLVGPCAIDNPRYEIKYVSAEELETIVRHPKKKFAGDMSGNLIRISQNGINTDLDMQVKDILNYKYPYENIISVKSKYSVSDLKHAAMEQSDLLEARLTDTSHDKPIPVFISGEETVTAGINRGNAYHKVFELLDYGRVYDNDSLREFLTELVSKNIITPEVVELIRPDKYEKFLNSSLGNSMKKAFLAHKLYREQPYIMEIGANRVNDEYPESEKVLVQGIIDAFYIEDEKVHIVDYKTDRVSGEEVLIERYKKQLELYKEAVEKITGLSVACCHIYSVFLDKDIILP